MPNSELCPGCGDPLDDLASTTEHVDIMQWGRRVPTRQLERDTVYCSRCDRIIVVCERDVTPPELSE